MTCIRPTTMDQRARRLPVGVLGATGVVGQRLLALLAEHPWFRVAAIAGSERRRGQRYRDAVPWRLPGSPPGDALDMPLLSPEDDFDVPLLFSALPATVAETVEPQLAARGHVVCSNASSHRMVADVPLLIPEVNPDHLPLLEAQRAVRGWSGLLLTNPNCSTIQLALALKPLADQFGIRRVQVTTLQALSGAGYPGVSAYDLLDNAIPYIGEEEEKIERETPRILGRYQDGAVRPAELLLSAQCTRVPVREGHLACVAVELEEPGGVSAEDVRRVWSEFAGEPQRLGLPTAPAAPIVVRAEPDRPQPLLDRDAGGGMAIVVGRLRECPNFGFKFVVLGHNTVRGAAGAALLNAELLHQRGLV